MNVYIETFGCSANRNDSEIMAGLLTKAGGIIVKTPELADVIVVNTCVVKGQSENQMKRTLKRHTESGKKIVVTGCMPEVALEEIEKINPDAAILGTHQIPKIVDSVKKVVVGEKTVKVGLSNFEKVGLPKVLSNPSVETIQINEGCTGTCSYCIVKRVKPELKSYSEESIIKGIEQAVNAGCKEIWLTSQDTAAYGFDRSKKSELPELLKKIVSVEGKFKIRLGMMNPDNIKNSVEELTSAMKSDKVFKFVHIPVQAGSDKVLKDMNRKYRASDFEHIVEELRNAFPNIMIATDIICGYPTETEEDFEETMKLLKKTRPGVINISRYTKRDGTVAAKLKLLPGEVVKERSKKVTAILEEISSHQYEDIVGKEFDVVIEDRGKNVSSIGRDNNYRTHIIKERIPRGKFVRVKVTNAKTFYAISEIVKK